MAPANRGANRYLFRVPLRVASQQDGPKLWDGQKQHGGQAKADARIFGTQAAPDEADV